MYVFKDMSKLRLRYCQVLWGPAAPAQSDKDTLFMMTSCRLPPTLNSKFVSLPSPLPRPWETGRTGETRHQASK